MQNCGKINSNGLRVTKAHRTCRKAWKHGQWHWCRPKEKSKWGPQVCLASARKGRAQTPKAQGASLPDQFSSQKRNTHRKEKKLQHYTNKGFDFRWQVVHSNSYPRPVCDRNSLPAHSSDIHSNEDLDDDDDHDHIVTRHPSFFQDRKLTHKSPPNASFYESGSDHVFEPSSTHRNNVQKVVD